ncbi:hypothetical protein ABZY44_01010 [Streptomyces sp. NPDC006544]|uniref:hypothetical protein n=1 Tax=Streptomyces sp. NPDC006544 TaxID=3154583 RepID=UPI0033A31B8F
MTDGNGDGAGAGAYHHIGDNVTVNGSHNIGIVKNHSPSVSPSATPALDGQIEALRRMLLELRAQVEPASARSIDRNLPAITSGPAEETAAVEGGFEERRHGALMAVAGIAAVAGEIGVPVLAAVTAILRLLGGAG